MRLTACSSASRAASMRTPWKGSSAVATGLKIAQPNKTYIIVVGDGDAASIGTSHLIHAARRNLGVTVICEDNMGYESTGGQFSPTTPAGYVTNSSPYGMIEPSFDPCDIVKAAFDELVGREVLVEGYGLTETSPLTHANPIHQAKPGSIGIPIADTDAKIVDLATGADLPAGEPGELVIRGPQVMKGYWHRPEETAAAMAGGWFHTGDVARMDDGGYFIIVDRMKDQINTAGFKVWPREVEEVIYAHHAVQMVAVIGIDDAYRGEVVKACVVLKAEHRQGVEQAELLSFCQERLMPYKVPRIVEFRDELPLSAAGKMLRRLLRDGPA
jgi:acyl-CoA synthetase (AMP-forming)/AMP-acid ligase II